MTVRLLCVGDMHLGRRPPPVPPALTDRVGLADLSAAAAWERTVQSALAAGVDAVLLAGDVVDQADDFFEAYGRLETGVRRLTEAGLAVVGVAGNHDVEVLPRLADAIPRFRLLGRGGVWEPLDIAGRDGAAVQLWGWSFPSPEVRESPLDHPSAGRLRAHDGRVPRIGLLHCDLDRRVSRHAPVSRRALEAAGGDAWLLGHIHRPDPLSGPRPIGYLGSLAGLDPSESGAHGPWLLEVGRRGSLRIEQLPLAPLRWETLPLVLEPAHEPADVVQLLLGELEDLHRRLAHGEHRPRAVGCRVAITGRNARRAAIERALAADDPRELWFERDGVGYFVERVSLDLRPVPEIASLARSGDPAGLLAQRILVLQRGPEDRERRALLAAAAQRLESVREAPEFRRFEPLRVGDELAAVLESAAFRALDALLAQRPGEGESAAGAAAPSAVPGPAGGVAG